MSQIAVESMSRTLPHHYHSIFSSAATANPKWSSGLRTTTLNSSPSEFKPKVPVLQPASSLTTYPLAKVLLSKASNALKSNSENRQKISKSPIPKLVVSKNHQEDITNASTEKEKKFDDNVWGIFRTRENFSDMHIC